MLEELMNEVMEIKNILQEINSKLSQNNNLEQVSNKTIYPCIYKMKCKLCGQEYMSNTKAKRFCSDKCKKEYTRKQQQEYHRKRNETLTEEEKEKISKNAKDRMAELRKLRSKAIAQIIEEEQYGNK